LLTLFIAKITLPAIKSSVCCVAAVEEVNDDAYRHPDKEAYPSSSGKTPFGAGH